MTHHDPVIERNSLWREIGAEAVGTFALVFAGCGAVMVNDITGGRVTHAGVAMTFGLVIMVMIYATGHISGAHFNPVVTVAFASLGRFPWRRVPGYVVGQVGAALFAALMLRMIFGTAAHLGATHPSGTLSASIGLETVLTFFLMFVITAVATDARAQGSMAGVAIGGTVALAALFGGPISGASMNPARSLGPALAGGGLADQWIYLIAPLAGALMGAFCYRLICCSADERRGGHC
ncbi:MAG: aquaporin [Deltaproteobacteria bacterium]|nr:aquaporin [Deltaproteobacteria bacterium]MCB9478713.1 aquaporin [Deltaproteobacteria bacterium]MCB9488229.1 aquaporin [Deltaproteobacteria bacterium]